MADDKKRTRSPAYPSIDLEEAIGYAVKVHAQESHHAFTPEAAAEHWEYKSTSSAVSQIISALKQFGLLVEEPGNGVRRVKLSPLGLKLIASRGETHDLQIRAQVESMLKTAALSPKLHQEIWDKYGGQLPSDTSLRIYLLTERDVPFNKDQVDRFISQLKGTISYAKVTKSDKMLPADDELAEDEQNGKGEERPERQRRRPPMPGTTEDVLNLPGEGQIVIQMPARLTQEGFTDFESWLDLVKRKAKRAMESTPVDEPEDGQ